ncbi:MAG: wax ester/triacylglycerol synthase domain-containing protein, partial [Chloroflexota bacterium]
MEEKYAKILGPVDTAFYYTESSEAPMNIGSVAVFEGRINFDDILNTIDSRIHRAPIYQQKVVQPPLFLGQPMWVFDPDFDIRNHVMLTRVDSPGDDESLRALASILISSTLDRSKPLWEIYMIEGLSDNRTAFFFKIHHCMVDGLAAVELFTLLFDLTPEIEPLQEKPVYNPPPMPSS